MFPPRFGPSFRRSSLRPPLLFSHRPSLPAQARSTRTITYIVIAAVIYVTTATVLSLFRRIHERPPSPIKALLPTPSDPTSNKLRAALGPFRAALFEDITGVMCLWMFLLGLDPRYHVGTPAY
ncbi:hypothetical protein DFH08DRAFT_812967 [Mycena albidolilacea]|uniref:Uncharacterized protein n=1 Tax=Mycena albidolilacea TaxID=1033008 RepID=A0AAD6ZT82_9AGAR|nr:hypothetical protein DFH08DRAFT_812967 [Mycena albidolilacea]